MIVDRSITQSSGISGDVLFSNLAADMHSVRLEGLAADCAVSSPNPRNVTIAAGGPAQATFTIECSSLLGSLTVTTETTGPDPDSDCYAVVVDGVPGGPRAPGT